MRSLFSRNTEFFLLSTYTNESLVPGSLPRSFSSWNADVSPSIWSNTITEVSLLLLTLKLVYSHCLSQYLTSFSSQCFPVSGNICWLFLHKSVCPHLKRQTFLQEYLIIICFKQPLLKWCLALNTGKKLNQVQLTCFQRNVIFWNKTLRTV